MDLITTSTSHVYHWRNNGNQVYSQVWSEFLHNDMQFGWVQPADYDLDGDVDLVVAGRSHIGIVDNNNGEFGDYRTVALTNSSRKSIVLDLTNDGYPEIAYTGSSGPRVLSYDPFLGQFRESFVLGTDFNTAYGITAGDLDGDGNAEILVGDHGSGKVRWYKTSHADTVKEIVLPNPPANLDARGAIRKPQGITFYDHGDFTRSGIVTASASFTRPHSARVVDMDGDQDLDIVVAAGDGINNTLAWLENSGVETFTKNVISTTPDYITDSFPYDYDHDGDIDIVVASTEDETLWLYTNTGSQQFSPAEIDNSFPGVTKVEVTDLNSDGVPEIIAAGPVSYTHLTLPTIYSV